MEVTIHPEVLKELEYIVQMHKARGAPNPVDSVPVLVACVLSAVADGSREPGAWERSMLESMGLIADNEEHRSISGALRCGSMKARKFMKTYVFLVALLASFGANAACLVEWPAEAIQKFDVRKAVVNVNPGATVGVPVIAAPGLARISFRDSTGRPHTVVLTYEHSAVDCVGDTAPNELLRNPTRFRVLSYVLVPVSAD